MFNGENSRSAFESFNSSTSRVARPPMWKNPALYKSRLCDSWIKGATCRFGVHCWFAHGSEELRKLPFLANDSAAKTLALAQVVQSVPPDPRGRQYANAAELAYASEFAKSTAPMARMQQVRSTTNQSDSFANPLVAATHNQFHHFSSSSHFLQPPPLHSFGPPPFYQSAPVQYVHTTPVPNSFVDQLPSPIFMNRDFLYV